ncbi:MAG: PAS domain S-box protein [Burkholderiaceae bacterium]|nr:PAS domain S-box protein [Burkholderiaceae bacterium]
MGSDHARLDGLALHSRELLASLVASSNDAIITKTLDGIVTSWNPAAEQIFGFSATEMLGHSVDKLLPPERIAEEQQILASIALGKRVEHFETLRICKNGRQIAVSVTVSPIIDANGTVIGASKIARDITEKRRAEDELQAYRLQLQRKISETTGELSAIVQTAANAIITTDAAGLIDVFNPAAEEMFGWRHTEMRGKSVACLMPEQHAGSHQRYFQRAEQSSRHQSIGLDGLVRARRRNGETFPVSIALGHTELTPGQPYFVAFITDISAQRSIEEDLRRAKDQAEAAVRAKASFLANMSHEIRTPMNAIIGFSELVLREAGLSSSAREHVHTVHQSARDLLSIINDILDYSKIEGGKTEIEQLPFSLAHLLRDVLKLLDPDARHKQLALQVELAPDLPPVSLGDPTRIRQILLNLVGNAIKFTHAGNVTIRIDLQADHVMHFAVRDTGIGMTQAQLDKVFDSFTQADVSTTRRFGGTGLGTTICRNLVELMHGKIWAESRYGQGSTFHFTLPLPAISNPASAVLLESHQDELSSRTPRAFRILLAEDVATNARLVSLRLTQLGHDVVWKENGRLTVDACLREDFDVILMDVMMPDMDGLEATRAIRQMRPSTAPHLPIIALTASVLPEDHRRCLDAGMDSVLGKPIDLGEICSHMEQLVPRGRGRFNSSIAPAPELRIPPALQALAPLVDLPRALRLWGDATVYQAALQEFCRTHRSDAARIAEHLTVAPELARRTAHALKGVAGNLHLAEVASLAAYVDTALKAGDRGEAAAQTEQLQMALERLLGLVDSALPSALSALPVLESISAAELVQLLQDLRAALDLFNPDSVNPMLTQLIHVMPAQQIHPVVLAVQHFDFELAASLTDQLILQPRGMQ